MEENNLKELLNELDLRGFSDEMLEADLKRFAALNLPVFIIRRTINFDSEQLDYGLLFKRNDKELQFELRGLDVTHYSRIRIESNKYLGFDTAELDIEMAKFDWKQYWELSRNEEQLPEELNDTYNIIHALSQFLLSDKIEIIQTAEALMYKYFPAETYPTFILDTERLDYSYKRNSFYDLNSYPNITATTAYLQISGRTDSLKTQLEEFLPKQVPDLAIRKEIHRKLYNPMDEALLNFTWVTKERLVVELNIPVEQKDHWLYVNQYQIIVTQLPELKKGVFNGVDSELLDKKLQAVDWKGEEDLVYAKNDNTIAFNREVELIQEELFRMALDPEGRMIADLLMLNYFFGIPFFEDQISPGAWDMWKGLPQKVVYLTYDIPVDKVLNMLDGRPVVLHGAPGNFEPGVWHKLEFFDPEKAGELNSLKGLSVTELVKMLENTPLEIRKVTGFAEKLMDGYKIKTKSNSRIPVSIMMSDNADKLIICNQQGHEIPINFQLDPNWKPEVNVTTYKEKKHKRSAEKFKAATKR